jgi:hypothetical protein
MRKNKKEQIVDAMNVNILNAVGLALNDDPVALNHLDHLVQTAKIISLAFDADSAAHTVKHSGKFGKDRQKIKALVEKFALEADQKYSNSELADSILEKLIVIYPHVDISKSTIYQWVRGIRK